MPIANLANWFLHSEVASRRGTRDLLGIGRTGAVGSARGRERKRCRAAGGRKRASASTAQDGPRTPE